MPVADLHHVSLHYEISGPESAPAVVFSHSLGTDLHMWDRIVPHLERDFRVLRYDTRGHGGSSTPDSPWSLRLLAEDLLCLLDALCLDGVQFCGLSLGGQVGLWLGVHSPDRIHKMVLANTAAKIGSRESWDARMATVQSQGMAQIADTAPDRWFTGPYIASHPDEMRRVRELVQHTPQPGYLACCAVLRDTDLRGDLAHIQTPCLIIAGTHDAPTPPADGRALHSGLPHAAYAELDASHLSAWEQPDEFAGLVRNFLLEKEGAHG